MLYLLLVAASYVVFVFIAESLNPFQLTGARVKRNRWKFGRSVALVMVLVGLSCLLLRDFLQMNLQLTMGVFITCTLFLMIPGYVKYRRRKIWH